MTEPGKAPNSAWEGFRPSHVEALALHLLDQTFGETMSDDKDTNADVANPEPGSSGLVMGEGQKTQPKEFGMPKIGDASPEEDENTYAPSPPTPALTVQTHDRDSVQPGPTAEGVYAPEAKRKNDNG